MLVLHRPSGNVPDCTMQPACEGLCTFDFVSRLSQDEEGRLEDIIRLMPVVDRSQRHPVDQQAIPLHDLRKGIRIPPLHECSQ